MKKLNKYRKAWIESKNLLLLLFMASLTASSFSCRKFIEVAPPFTALNVGNVYTTDETAAAVLTDIYAGMSSENTTLMGHSITSIPLYAALAADELTLYDLNYKDLLDCYRNDLNKASRPNYWESIFTQIFAANNALEGVTNSTHLTPKVKQQLLGEAKFIRAFLYFYLINMYGDVPLVLNLDYKTNALLPRTPIAKVYEQIILDLKEAKQLLSNNYLKGDALTEYTTGEEERVRPTKWAAAAMLARTYLYSGDYANAETEATAVINKTSLYGLTEVGETFLKNNKESIWQLQPVGIDADANTGEGKIFVLPDDGPGINNPVYLNNHFVNNFEKGDYRKESWISSISIGTATYYYAYKYKIGNVAATTQEYPTILRLAELYLIRAEARTAKGDISGAQSDLNTVRMRAGLNNTSATDKTTLHAAILKERQLEFFTEWGHRWFDLKRTNRINDVMNIVTPAKGGTWRPHQALFPLPQTDIDRNPNLVQNPGY